MYVLEPCSTSSVFPEVAIRTVRNCMAVVFCCVACHTAARIAKLSETHQNLSIISVVIILTLVYMIISLLNTADMYLRQELMMYDHSGKHMQESHNIVINVSNASDEPDQLQQPTPRKTRGRRQMLQERNNTLSAICTLYVVTTP